jgi:hypothetical protein
VTNESREVVSKVTLDSAQVIVVDAGWEGECRGAWLPRGCGIKLAAPVLAGSGTLLLSAMTMKYSNIAFNAR